MIQVAKSDIALVGAESRNVSLGEESGSPTGVAVSVAPLISSHPCVECLQASGAQLWDKVPAEAAR